MKRDSRGFSLLELLIVVAIILIIATIAIPSLLRSRQAANESGAVADLRTINTAEVSYQSSAQGSFGTISQLVGAGLLDGRFSAGAVGGYNYSIAVDPTGTVFTSFAEPASTNNGRYGYYSIPDGLVRWATTASEAPVGMAGSPVQ